MQTLRIIKLFIGLCAFIFCATPVLAQTQGDKVVTVSGTITSAEDNEPLIGVSIVTDSFQGVTSMVDGTYSIDVKAGSTLTFSYLGFQTVEWIVPDGEAKVKYDLAMQGEAEAIDDVVVIAYGVRKKGTVAGSVSTVKTEKIESLTKCFYIITSREKEIVEFINNKLHRGATVSMCTGSFTHEDKKIIITVLSRTQAMQLKNFIKETGDGTDFTIITNSSDIIGKGFRSAI